VFGDVAFAQAPFAALGGATVLSSVSEAATAADSVAQETRAGALILEIAAASEAFVSLNNIMTAVRAELATATATQNFAASNFVATQAETATGTDTPAAAPSTFFASRAESASATDASSAIANLLAAIAEISTASDAVVGGTSFQVTITESAVGSHTQSATARFNGSIQELASGLDAYGKLKIANVYPAGIQLNVYVGQVLVWGTIPTGQTPPAPDWTEIPT
jgi:hypothetical protein